MLAVIHFLSLVLSYGFTVLQMLSELISNDIRIFFDISFDLFYFNHFFVDPSDVCRVCVCVRVCACVSHHLWVGKQVGGEKKLRQCCVMNVIQVKFVYKE